MLILTRRPGERVVIGDEILVTVMSVSGHTVRLGIAAPGGVPIYREEIWLAVQGGEPRGGRRRGRRVAERARPRPTPASPPRRAAPEAPADSRDRLVAWSAGRRPTRLDLAARR